MLCTSQVQAAVRSVMPGRSTAAATLKSSRSALPLFFNVRHFSLSSPPPKAKLIRPSLGALAVTISTRPNTRQQVRRYAAKREQIVKVPQMAESISEGTLKSWNKNVGEFVNQDEEVVSIETDKVDVAVNAPFSGIVKEVYAKEEEVVTVGANLFKLEEGEAGDATAPASAQNEQVKKEDTRQVAPSQKKDVLPPKPEKKPEVSPAEPASTPITPERSSQPALSDHRSEHRVKMSRMRSTIAARLKESQNTAASLTTFNEVDMTNLMDLRSTYKELVLKQHGVKLGFMSAFTKAVCHALKAVPVINATIVDDSIVYRDYMDISVAVATPKGLVTPVIRNAEQMTMVEVENEIALLGAKARENKITLEDLTGGTFTISNGGIYGSLYGTPIINMPQSAILGMHAVKERPVAVNGEVKIRPMMYLALTYDHRLIDGREAVTFLVKVKEAIEDPRRLLLDV